ncbi:scavenger receptor cysteine-rich type 1 protein M130-like, partial [Ruditapes philippinarum]|uniref:scavenger receptor cysteine-rich type 1 protein M130-like n=1 Tax=Ruditapes philippinarum TaxID=129788 RepID=UPI00295A9A8C
MTQETALVALYKNKIGPFLNITAVRLTNGTGLNGGRAEIKVNDTWGTICDSNFDNRDAEVFCNMLGLKAWRFFTGALYGKGGGPVYIDQLFCNSYDVVLSDCQYLFLNECSHSRDVSIVCYGPFLNITDVRLTNGTGLNDGRAEIKVNDTWGTICDSNFGYRDAEVFCNMLGLKAVRFFTGALYGEGDGPVHIDQLFCDSYDVVLSDCQYLFLNECSHSRDVSIVCNECGEPDNSHWDAGYFTYNGSTLYADCSFYKSYLGILKMTCDNVTQTWQTEGECQEYGYPLVITEIKLSGGNSTSNGRVEIKSMDTWGTVCDHGFGKNEADTICTMIGFPPAASFHHGAYFGEGSGPIFVDDLQCADNSTHINNCSYVTYDNCFHFNDVSVVCTECPSPKPTNGSINSSSTHYLAAVTVTCADGYNLIGDSEIRCELNATWSSSPTCKLIDCGIPNLVNAEATLSENKTTYGETAVVSCYDGYQPGGSYLVSCLANGTWKTWPECTSVDCGDPTPNQGKSNVTVFTYGTVAKIECEPGFNIYGDSMIICQSDGTWSDYPVCDTS